MDRDEILHESHEPVHIEHPPKLVRERITPWRDTRMSPHLGDPTMPALQSFQEFLDRERVRLRRRLYVLSACFLGILICTLFGSLVLGMSFMDRMNSRFAELAEHVDSGSDGTTEFQAKTEAQLAAATSNQERIVENVETMQSDAEALRRALRNWVSPVKEDLAAMRALSRELRDENQKLRSALQQLQKDYPELERRVALASAAPRSPMEPSYQTSAPHTAKTRQEQVLTMSIVPAGSRHPLTWRFPASME